MALNHLDSAAFMSNALVPAVLVSACALLLLSFNNRIVAVLTRQRVLHRELLEGARKQRASFVSHHHQHPPVHAGVLASACFSAEAASLSGSRSSSHRDLATKEDQAAADERFATSEWATAIERQIRDLHREAGLIRAAISCLLCAILCFLVSGVLLAASTVAPGTERPAVAVFLVALLSFAISVLLMISESLLIISPVLKEETHLRRIISAQSQLSLQVLT